MYSIVEFDDGIFAIPTIWLSEDKKRSKWPPYDDKKILKAVSKREQPDENWEFLDVKNIFGTAHDYDSATKKVSLAEQLADISDQEKAKKTRKNRARCIGSESENSDNENHPPQKKSKQIKKTKKRAVESNIYPQLLIESSSITKSPTTSVVENNDNTKCDSDITIVQEKSISMAAADIDVDSMSIQKNTRKSVG